MGRRTGTEKGKTVSEDDPGALWRECVARYEAMVADERAFRLKVAQEQEHERKVQAEKKVAKKHEDRVRRRLLSEQTAKDRRLAKSLIKQRQLQECPIWQDQSYWDEYRRQVRKAWQGGNLGSEMTMHSGPLPSLETYERAPVSHAASYRWKSRNPHDAWRKQQQRAYA